MKDPGVQLRLRAVAGWMELGLPGEGLAELAEPLEGIDPGFVGGMGHGEVAEDGIPAGFGYRFGCEGAVPIAMKSLKMQL